MKPAIILDTLNALTDPTSFNIFQIIIRKTISYDELIRTTQLNNKALSKHIEKLSRYSLIKVDFTKIKNGKYVVYRPTKVGKSFQQMLHDIILEFDTNITPNITGKFVIDCSSFKKILKEKTLSEIKQLFRDGIIVFTSTEFSNLLESIEDEENDKVEDFLFDERFVNVTQTYDNIEKGVRTEYYLRRAKKLQQDKAQVIATAVDLNASIISNDEKLLQYAKQLDCYCTHIDSVLKLKKDDSIIEKFSEISSENQNISKRELTNFPYVTNKLKKN